MEATEANSCMSARAKEPREPNVPLTRTWNEMQADKCEFLCPQYGEA